MVIDKMIAAFIFSQKNFIFLKNNFFKSQNIPFKITIS